MPAPATAVGKPSANDFEGLAAYYAEEADAMGVDAPLFALQANTYARLAELQARRTDQQRAGSCAA